MGLGNLVQITEIQKKISATFSAEDNDLVCADFCLLRRRGSIINPHKHCAHLRHPSSPPRHQKGFPSTPGWAIPPPPR